MIVAIYANTFSFELPINPVNRTSRITPQNRRQQRSKQNQKSSFAAMLNAMLQAEDSEDASEFDAYA